MLRHSEPETRAGWHLDKKVPISIIVTLLVIGVSGIWAIADIRRDVDVLKVQIAAQRERDQRQDDAQREALAQLRADLQDIGRKLDRLIEREGSQQHRQRP